MTTTTPWSDTPPSEPGEFWVCAKCPKAARVIVEFHGDGLATWPGESHPEAVREMIGLYYFGPRVLSAEESVKLTAERDEAFALVEEYHRAINPRRGELIDRQITRVATEPELEELERLQALTDRMLRLLAPLPIAELDARIQRLKDEGKLDDELPDYRSVPFADAGKIKVRVSGVTPLEPMSFPIDDGVFHGA